jgi:hypothetical protein
MDAFGFLYSSGLMALILFCWAVTFPQRRHATNRLPLPIPVISFVAAMDLVALTLGGSALAVSIGRLAGVYAASLTAILIGAAMLFLFTFVHWYDALPGQDPET